MKKKKILLTMTALTVAMSLSACQNERINCVEGCSCTDCPCCDKDNSDVIVREDLSDESSEEMSSLSTQEETQEETSQTEDIQEETETEENTESTDESEENETTSEETKTDGLNEIQRLTEGEKAARREQQLNFDEARQLLYSLENSKDKTEKIVQMDKQILNNNSYDFSNKSIVFVGDSITEGITSAVDKNGNMISYVTYADAYLHFRKVLNHGKGGRMFSDYGGEELSIVSNSSNILNIDSDIIVIFAGVNDYLTSVPEKRFGNVENKQSSAGFCGALRVIMGELQRYYSDKDIFFVTMYDVSKTSECSYSDYDGQPDLGDYMEAERQLAEEYGFNVIDLYDIGFMDCTDKESSDYYLRDGLHPKDNGNIALGAHIAAELSLYFSQNEQ